MIVKDSARISGYRERIIHNVKFNLTGYIQFISEYQNFLVNNLKFKKTKLNMYKRSPKVCTMEYSGRNNIKKFYDFLYKDATFYLSRKKEKFEEIIRAFNK